MTEKTLLMQVKEDVEILSESIRTLCAADPIIAEIFSNLSDLWENGNHAGVGFELGEFMYNIGYQRWGSSLSVLEDVELFLKRITSPSSEFSKPYLDTSTELMVFKLGMFPENEATPKDILDAAKANVLIRQAQKE